MSLSGFDIWAHAIKDEPGSILSNFWNNSMQNWHHFLLKSLAEFIRKLYGPRVFLLLEAVNYKYNFFIHKESLRLFVSSWLSFGLSWRSNVTCSLYLSCWIYWHKLFKILCHFCFFNMCNFCSYVTSLIFDIGNYIHSFSLQSV